MFLHRKSPVISHVSQTVLRYKSIKHQMICEVIDSCHSNRTSCCGQFKFSLTHDSYMLVVFHTSERKLVWKMTRWQKLKEYPCILSFITLLSLMQVCWRYKSSVVVRGMNILQTLQPFMNSSQPDLIYYSFITIQSFIFSCVCSSFLSVHKQTFLLVEML